MAQLSFSLVRDDIGVWVSIIRGKDEHFDSVPWLDRREARRILDEAKAMLASNPSKARVEAAVRALWALEPDAPKEGDDRVSADVLRR